MNNMDDTVTLTSISNPGREKNESNMFTRKSQKSNCSNLEMGIKASTLPSSVPATILLYEDSNTTSAPLQLSITSSTGSLYENEFYKKVCDNS